MFSVLTRNWGRDPRSEASPDTGGAPAAEAPGRACVESGPEPAPVPGDAAALEPPTAERRRFRVLVVDDNPVNRQVMGLILESAGLDHAAVGDGAQAVEAVTHGGYDAILMDVQMPVMDGLEATRRIRELERAGGRPRIPLYIVSANGFSEHVDAGRAAGADGYFLKPVSATELLIALHPHVTAFARAA